MSHTVSPPARYGVPSDTGGPGGDLLHLRSLVIIRWVAITGQIVTLLIARNSYHIGFPLGFCFVVVGLSVIVNLLLVFLYPGGKRLSERQLFLILTFDLGQLAVLLWLTGGMTNPFALLILVPVTISATALSPRSTLVLGGLAVISVSLLALNHLPLTLPGGIEFALPGLFAFGFWLSVVIGILFLGSYAQRVAGEINTMRNALLATQMALARAQKLTDLGGVVAAAAHELGTPLATIKLVSTEMIEELSDQPELCEDARMIRNQADRCREILRGMGQAGKDDLQMRQAPLETLLREAAGPHLERDKTVLFHLQPLGEDLTPPVLLRQPETIHGLRNLIQNAVDFADSKVWLEAEWSASRLLLRIIDDGPGFPAHVLGRLGEPFMRSRRSASDLAARPEYEGMGLGLFIAKTLLERTGAELHFANAAPEMTGKDNPHYGAIIEVIWPIDQILAPRGSLGNNPQNL